MPFFLIIRADALGYYRETLQKFLNLTSSLHIPESDEGKSKWLKAQPVVYRWTSEAGWVTTSYEAMKMKAVNHEPMISLKGTTFPLGS